MIFYYILVDPDKENKTKLGITKNPQQRIKAYRTAAPSCYFKKIYKIPHKSHEKRILEEIRSAGFSVHSEYVHAHSDLIQNIVESYLDDKNIQY
jgi:hypothetical protein